MKYIDAEKLIAEIRKLRSESCISESEDYYEYAKSDIIDIIDSLQQEQNSIQDTELTGFESALFTAFSYAWQSYLRGEEVDVVQWVKDCSKDLLEAAGCQQEQQEEPDKSLEEEYMDYVVNDPDYSKLVNRIAGLGIARHFAEWQQEQKCHGCFNRDEVFMRGMKYAKEQMMKEAIHYVVQDDLDSHGASYNIPFIRIGIAALKPKGIGVGDKVRIIILKDNEDESK